MMRWGTLFKVKNFNAGVLTKRGVVHSQSASFASKGKKQVNASVFVNISSFAEKNYTQALPAIQTAIELKRWFSNIPEKKEVPLASQTPTEADKDKKALAETSKSEPKSEPLEKWSEEEVQQWFHEYPDKEKPKFRKYAERFQELDGKSLAGLTKETFQKELGPIIGEALFNAVQEELKKPQQEDPIERVLTESKSLFKDSSEILEYFITKAPFRSKRKEDKTKFQPLYVVLQTELVDRQESLNHFWDAIGQSSQIKSKVPLPATQSAPGGGKTAFLNLVASTLSKSPQLKTTQNQIPILVTFNSTTPYNTILDEDPVVGLGLRMISTFYFESPEEFWKESQIYFAKLKGYLSLSFVIDAILKTIHRECPDFAGIFLGVDEISKREVMLKQDQISNIQSIDLFIRELKNAQIQQILSNIGKALDKYSREEFNVLVTSLQPDPILRESTESGRPIKWIPLPLLSSIYKIFPPEYEGIPVINQVLSDCNGHPRSLEAVYRTLDQMKKKGEDISTVGYLKLMDAAVGNYTSGAPEIPRELVVAALKGRMLNKDVTIGKFQFLYWLGSGALINTNAIHNSIPTLSPFFLRIFFNQQKDYSDPLYLALQKVVKPFENDQMQWYDFERFHAYWEILIRIVYQGENISYKTIYHLDSIPSNKVVATLPVFKPIAKEYRGVTDFYSEQNASFAEPFGIGSQVSHKDLEKYIFAPEAGTHSIETCIFDRLLDGNLSCIGFQCKFSTPGSATDLKKGDVKDASLRFQQTIKKLIEVKKLPQEIQQNVFYVVLSIQEVAKNNSKTQEQFDQNNVVLLGPTLLAEVYSPTLQSRIPKLPENTAPQTKM